MERRWGARLLITACAVVLGGCGVEDGGAFRTDIEVDQPGGGGAFEEPTSEAVTAPLRFVAIADATARSAYPSTNYAAQTTLNVDRSPDEEVYLRFFVSGVSANSTGVAKAVLRLYTTNGSSAGPALYATTTGWSESALTWNTRPARTSASLGTRNPTAGAYVEYDVTSLVKGDGEFAFALIPMSTDGADFASRESSDATRRPELVVTLSGSTEPPPPSGSPLTFVASADASIQQAYPNTNYGRTSTLLSDASPAESGFVRFSVAGLSGTVSKAEVRLYVTNGSSNGPALYATATGWSETGVTWNTRPARTGGVLGDAGTLSTGTWVSYDVTSLVKTNGDFSFELVATSSDGTDVASREYSDAAKRPVLVITLAGTTEPPPPGRQTVVVGALADTTISQGAPDTAYGSSTTLRTDNYPAEMALLRFRVAQPSGRIVGARLRLYVVNGSSDGPMLYRTTSDWSEASTWNSSNASVLAVPALKDLGAISTGSWVELDISGAIKAAGDYDFELETLSTDGADFASSEYSDSTKRPQLVLTIDPSTPYVTSAIQYGRSFASDANGPVTRDAATRDLVFGANSYKMISVVRMRPDRSIAWERQFYSRDPYSGDDDSLVRIAALAAAPDGTFWSIIRVRMGEVQADAWLLKSGEHLVQFGPDGQIRQVQSYDWQGGYLWAADLAVAPDGDVVVVGTLEGVHTFGTRTIDAGANRAAWVQRLSPHLETRWVRFFRSGSAVANDVAVAPNGDVLAGGGQIGSGVDFDGHWVAANGVSNGETGFLVRLSAAGEFQWAKLPGKELRRVAFSRLGTAVATGEGDTLVWAGKTSSGGGYGGHFLIVAEVDGAERWQRYYQRAELDDLGVDDAGSVRIVGVGDQDLGGGRPGARVGFVARINLDGAYQWMFTYAEPKRHFEEAWEQYAYVAPDGKAYVTGTFGGTQRYDAYTLTAGGDDMFLLELAP